ncbi:ATP-binding protein [Actinomadura adrarensis]|uniref:ATP-binding protein n=1 Tax=Actinomadura adrarensis TaxID=1819600 RepID=A0ABW3CSM0_9ACTN
MTRLSRLFSGRPESVRDARCFAWTYVAERVTGELAHSVELVVSELCTNAVEHTASGRPGGWFLLELEMHPDHVRVSVMDNGALATVPASSDGVDLDAVSGRGLFIVEAVSKAWGAENVLAGRRVWADVVGEVA